MAYHNEQSSVESPAADASVARNSGLHTPGPWRIVDQMNPRRLHSMALVRAGGDMAIDCTSSGATQQESNANAQLVAAAPDLLTALEDIYSGWLYIRRVHGDLYGVGWDRAQTKAAAAIAKARGQA